MLTHFNSFMTRYHKGDIREVPLLGQKVLSELEALAIAPTPIHFTVMFERLSQLDEELAQQIEETIQFNDYNDETAEVLFFTLLASILKKTLPTETFSNVLKDLQGDLHQWFYHFQIHQDRLLDSAASLQASLPTPLANQFQQTILPCLHGFFEQNKKLLSKVDQAQQEIEQLKQALDNAQNIAKTDELTNIRNRRGFNEAIAKAISAAKQEQQTFSLLLIDMDHFKLVNDRYGHLVGDSVLRYIARLLLLEVGSADQVSRIGGEEFAIILPKATYNQAKNFANQLREKIQNKPLKVKNQDKTIRLTVSIGVGIYQMGETSESLFSRTDKALYSAKTSGRNKVCVEEGV